MMEGSASMWSRQLIERDMGDLEALTARVGSRVLTDSEDQLIWAPNKGNFSTKTFYEVNLLQSPHRFNQGTIWNAIWTTKLPPKILLFLWKLQWGIIPTRKFLSIRIQGFNSVCAWCEVADESIDHLFWNCEVAFWAWEFIGKWWSISAVLNGLSVFSLPALLNCQKGLLAHKV
ncbi:hypothetical protein POM88_029707 [Heracleum sosnowskyi]|uniref:Reverse transcriptase zinc-binding domain-containing protein n=1 Tax=Heracleum sosnowskyi TaxID=360622 RepID=A0AAD8HVE1_9APIA|nr:hypothetical protein POM88_029707 [Heracleum sosnowskyi]